MQARKKNSDPLLGSVLAGRYEILAPVGSGGMARVHLAVRHVSDPAEAAALHSLRDAAGPAISRSGSR